MADLQLDFGKRLHLTLLDRAGVQVDSFGDSTGKLKGVFDT